MTWYEHAQRLLSESLASTARSLSALSGYRFRAAYRHADAAVHFGAAALAVGCMIRLHPWLRDLPFTEDWQPAPTSDETWVLRSDTGVTITGGAVDDDAN